MPDVPIFFLSSSYVHTTTGNGAPTEHCYFKAKDAVAHHPKDQQYPSGGVFNTVIITGSKFFQLEAIS